MRGSACSFPASPSPDTCPGLGRMEGVYRNASDKRDESIRYGTCMQCSADALGDVSPDDYEFYCHSCFEFDKLNCVRCMTFAAGYDEHGSLVTFGTSVDRCAERNALERNPDVHTLIACRIRRNEYGRITSYGMCMPCKQCIYAMRMHNVRRICYSIRRPQGDSKYEFEMMDVQQVSNTYISKTFDIPISHSCAAHELPRNAEIDGQQLMFSHPKTRVALTESSLDQAQQFIEELPHWPDISNLSNLLVV